MELILKKLEDLNTYVTYVNEKNDDYLTESLAKINIINEKIDRFIVRENKSEIEKKYKLDYEEEKEKNKENNRKGEIRVGRILTMQDKGRKKPITFGYLNIIIIAGPGKELGRELDSNILKYDGKILQNIWEFSKIYPQHLTVKNYNLLPHIKNLHEFIKPEYWTWQTNGWESVKPIRYPFGIMACGDHVGFIKKTGENIEFLTEPEARKKIFAPIYKKLVQKTDDYKKLQEMHNNGYNLQLCDLYALNIEQKGAYGEDKVGSVAIDANIIEKLINSNHDFTTACYIAAFLLSVL